MKKLSRKVVALLMSVYLGTTVCPVASVAASSEDLHIVTSQTEIEPRYAYISNTYISFLPSGVFAVRVDGFDEVQSVRFTVELQKKGLFGYSTVESLTKSYVGSSGSYSDSFDLDSSGTYRIKVTYEVFTANDSESTVKYKEA